MASASKPAANGTTYGSTLRGCVVGVTGGAGHIGQRLRSRLLAVGCAEVRSLDVHHSASALSLGGGKRDVCIDGSVTDAQACRQLANGADVVFHLAAAGMSGPAMLDAGLTNRVNVGGTFTLLDQCSQKELSLSHLYSNQIKLLDLLSSNFVFEERLMPRMEKEIPNPQDMELNLLHLER